MKQFSLFFNITWSNELTKLYTTVGELENEYALHFMILIEVQALENIKTMSTFLKNLKRKDMAHYFLIISDHGIIHQWQIRSRKDKYQAPNFKLFLNYQNRGYFLVESSDILIRYIK